MSHSVQKVNKVSAGLCPHGLAPNSCPICSNMGGGRVGEKPQKAGEMSYHQCVIIGAMMAARAQQIKNHQNILKQHALAIIAFQQTMDKMITKMQNFVNIINKNFFLKPVADIITNVVLPIINTIKNIPNSMAKFLNGIVQFKHKFIDIQDKLNAIFGEAKAFLEKKISELVSTIKTKFKSLFKIFQSNNTKNHDAKIDEEKKIFNFKTILQKIKTKFKRNDSKSKSRS